MFTKYLIKVLSITSLDVTCFFNFFFLKKKKQLMASQEKDEGGD
jgi:hypothetical protein